MAYSDQIYVRYTTNLNKRLSDHNFGATTHTAKYIPWKFEMYLAFDDQNKAIEFEKYLKSHSGRAFRDKRFL